jgi:DNA-binding beta-propeller fold protein YncE
MRVNLAINVIVPFAALCPVLGVLAYAQAPSAQQQRQPTVSRNGPVAVAMRTDSEAVILQLKGRVSTFDVHRWIPGSTLYSVPGEFDATDMSAATIGSRQFVCLVLDNHGSPSQKNFVLQLVNGQQIWSWLSVKGVYTAVAIDPIQGFVYTSNSTTNGVFRLRLGQQKQSAQLAVTFPEARRIGAIAVDPEGQRLFVADYDGRRIFVWPVKGGRPRSILVPELSEIRALAWDTRRRRLYIADSGSEGIWSVADDGNKAELLVRDRRFRQPSGVAVGIQDSLIVTDESSGSVVSVGVTDGAIRQIAQLPEGSATK